MSVLADLLPRLQTASPLGFDLNRRRCLRLDLSGEPNPPDAFDPLDAESFAAWIEQSLHAGRADYAAGGYAENRRLYRMSPHFVATDGGERSLRLGIDLWTAAATPVHAALDGVVHSTADNAAFGDYGPTIILEHAAAGLRFYTLYGHLARSSLECTREGARVAAGTLIGWLGEPHENVGWPPHLHFQVIADLEGRRGDYPGVCAYADRETWLERCPDPNLLLRIDALR